ncbi:MAG: hypothetical protein ABEJ72_01145 [Candidatus Aenigmatarchaeota archaeon]
MSEKLVFGLTMLVLLSLPASSYQGSGTAEPVHITVQCYSDTDNLELSINYTGEGRLNASNTGISVFEVGTKYNKYVDYLFRDFGSISNRSTWEKTVRPENKSWHLKQGSKYKVSLEISREDILVFTTCTAESAADDSTGSRDNDGSSWLEKFLFSPGKFAIGLADAFLG